MRELTYTQPLLQLSGTVSASGDTTLIAAPASGRQIVISSIQIQNESTTATTYLLKFGSTTVYRTLLVSQGDGVTKDMEPAWEVGSGNALVLNLSGANSSNYNVSYWIDSV